MSMNENKSFNSNGDNAPGMLNGPAPSRVLTEMRGRISGMGEAVNKFKLRNVAYLNKIN